MYVYKYYNFSYFLFQAFSPPKYNYILIVDKGPSLNISIYILCTENDVTEIMD